MSPDSRYSTPPFPSAAPAPHAARPAGTRLGEILRLLAPVSEATLHGPLRITTIIGVTALTVLIGVLDHWTNPDLSFAIFYLIPITLCVWQLGVLHGYISAIVAASVWFIVELQTPREIPFLIIQWNALVRLVFFVIFVALIAVLRRSKLDLQAEVARQTALLREIAETTSRDQARLARDLHDGIGQYLSGLALRTCMLAEDLAAEGSPRAGDARKLYEVVQNVSRESRRLDHFLGGLRTSDEDLGAALRRLVARIEQLFELRCALSLPATPLPLDPLQADTLFHIAQEGLNNALKHARGEGLGVQLALDSEGVRLCITDRGPGLPAAAPGSAGMGLRIMRQRAELIGAVLSITAGPDQRGVSVDCRLPSTALATHRG